MRALLPLALAAASLALAPIARAMRPIMFSALAPSCSSRSPPWARRATTASTPAIRWIPFAPRRGARERKRFAPAMMSRERMRTFILVALLLALLLLAPLAGATCHFCIHGDLPDPLAQLLRDLSKYLS